MLRKVTNCNRGADPLLPSGRNPPHTMTKLRERIRKKIRAREKDEKSTADHNGNQAEAMMVDLRMWQHNKNFSRIIYRAGLSEIIVCVCV